MSPSEISRSVSVRFSVGVRAQRVPTDDKLIVGMLLYSEDRVTHWSFDMRPADVLVIPPSTEHDGIFRGAAAYAAIRPDVAEVTSLFKGEPRLSDPAAWLDKNHFRAALRWEGATRWFPTWHDSRTVVRCCRRLLETVHHGRRNRNDRACAPAGLQRPAALGDAAGRQSRQYLDAAGLRPVHISESARTSTSRGGRCTAHSSTLSAWDRSRSCATNGFARFTPF